MFSHFLRKIGSLGGSAGRSRTLRLNGRKWRLAPTAMSHFGPAGPDLDRWLADGSAQIVKTGPHRTVYRVVLPGGTVYVKHCRIMGLRAWAREALRPPKACLEFENLLALQERGIAAVVPLAWGSADSLRPGESWLITESLDGAIPFTEFVDRRLGARERRELARALGRFFAKLHDAGVAHPDPHPGNLLVVETPQGPRFSLIDLHAVHLSRMLTWHASRANLVVFNRWFQLRASRTDRFRFWKEYCASRARSGLTVGWALPTNSSGGIAGDPNAPDLVVGSAHPTKERRVRDVERTTAVSNFRFWAGRVSRCLGTNRYFQKVKRGEVRGFAVRDLPDDVLAPLLDNPDALFTRLLKDSRTSTVAIVNLGGRELILKRVNVRHWTEPIKNLFRKSAVLRSWVNGHALRDRWLPTPRPLAALHRYRFGLPAEGYLLTELVEVAEPLTAKAQAAERIARILRAMHDRGVSHRDLKAANILLERGTEPAFIDLVGVRLGSPAGFRQRAKELARLNASFLADAAVTRSARLRFLLTYLNAGDPRIGDWRKWWKEIARATAAKQAKNRRTGRPLA